LDGGRLEELRRSVPEIVLAARIVMFRSTVFLALVPLCASGKDVICLKDGRVIESEGMHRAEGGIDIAYPHGRVHVPKEMILDAVLDEDAHVAPKTDEEREQVSKGFVRFEGRWLTAGQRDELVAKRVEKHRKLLEEMKSHGEWRNRQKQDTKFFHFEYTLPQHIFEPYRNAMEAYFSEFAKTWKIKAPKADDRLPVNFYIDETSFHQISGVPAGVLGYFRYVRPWDLNIFYERLDPTLSNDVMFHEANHYLQKLVNVQFVVPHFPGESLAEYYGASEWDPEKKKLTVGLIQEGRLCEIQTDIDAGNRMDLLKLISTPQMYEHYTWGWALVHFLMNEPRYAPKFQRFFLALAEAKGVQRESAANGMYTLKQEDVPTIFLRELGLKDSTSVRKLQAEWDDYIDTKLKLVTCSGYEKAAFKAKEVQRPKRATRLFKTAIDKGSKNPLVFHSLAELCAEDGQRDNALANWKRALELDPLEGQFYSGMARVVAASDKVEADRLRSLAKEIGNDDPWANQALGEESPEAPKPRKPGEPGDTPKD
jgi:tetratricopeptide (TPR) repeat protein